MADDVELPGAGALIATDQVGGRHFQAVKLAFGADGTATLVDASTGLPVVIVGTVPVSGPLTDTQLRATPVPITGSVTASGTLAVSNFPATQTITGTVTVGSAVAVSNFPATQAVTAVALPLPVGAATEATLAGLLTDTALRATPVTVADGGGSLTVDGTLAVSNFPATQAVSAAALPLPSGAATEATLAGLLTDAELRAAALAVTADALPLPAGAATEATLAAVAAKVAALLTTVPANTTAAPPVRAVGQDVWNASFSNVGSAIAPEFTAPVTGTGVSFAQAAGTLTITAGTTANAEFLSRSTVAWQGSLRARLSSVIGARTANNNFTWMLADLIGEGLAYNVVNSTTVDVTLPAHGFTAANAGQRVYMGAITTTSGVAPRIPGRYAIASIPDANTIRFTVAGWSASGTGTLTLFGHSYARVAFEGATATTTTYGTARRGWTGMADSAAAGNLTTAAPGAIHAIELTGREAFFYDHLRASTATPTITARASRYEDLPDDNLQLYLWIWSYNGTTAPASTTWAISFASVEKFANQPVYIQGSRATGAVNPIAVQTQGTVPVSLAANTPTLAAGTNRAAFQAAAGIWYDDSSTALGSGATFTGAARDATVTATATAMANAATYAKEVRCAAESDVAGTLWLEVSRDNTNWRRAKSIATVAVTGGGHYAEIVHRPSWRYWRLGYTNGGTAQARFTAGSLAMAA